MGFSVAALRITSSKSATIQDAGPMFLLKEYYFVQSIDDSLVAVNDLLIPSFSLIGRIGLLIKPLCNNYMGFIYS